MEIDRDSRVEEYPACSACVASFRIVSFKAFGRCLPERVQERRSIKLAAGDGFDSVQYLLGGMDAYVSTPLNECFAEFA